MNSPLRAPFPWFGGKSRAAHLVWAAFGDLPNYVDPFAGSLAVLLGRPTEPRIETVNDIDCYLANFWRAVALAPEEVAAAADWPVNEADLHARHRWLVAEEQVKRIERLRHEPDFFDAKIAGWWVWGICQWIGSGWCAAPEWWRRAHEGNDLGSGRRPHLRGQGINAGSVEGDNNQSLANSPNWQRFLAGRAPRGIHTAEHAQRPDISGERGVHRRRRDLSNAANWEKRPALGKGGRGIESIHVREQLPSISGLRGATGRGVHASGKQPKSDRGTRSRMQGGVLEWMLALAHRLRRVRVCCGDWTRVMGPAVTTCIGVTGVLLDPPYSDLANRDSRIYGHDSLTVAHAVREWALEHGDDPKLRIALCGYEGEHEMPGSWQCVSWKAPGGYAASAGNHENSARERIWFSPHCLPLIEKQPDLFAGGAR